MPSSQTLKSPSCPKHRSCWGMQSCGRIRFTLLAANGSIPALGMGTGAFPASHEMALETPFPHPEHLQNSSPSQSSQRMRLLPLHQSQRKSVISWMFTNKRRIWRQIKDDSPDLAQYQVPALTAFAWVPFLCSVAELGVSHHALIMVFLRLSGFIRSLKIQPAKDLKKQNNNMPQPTRSSRLHLREAPTGFFLTLLPAM